MPPLQVEDDAALPHQLYRIPAVHVRKTSDPFKSMAQAVFDSAESLPLLTSYAIVRSRLGFPRRFIV
jgi:hypothetical protein